MAQYSAPDSAYVGHLATVQRLADMSNRVLKFLDASKRDQGDPSGFL